MLFWERFYFWKIDWFSPPIFISGLLQLFPMFVGFVCGIFFLIVCTSWPEMRYWTLTKRGKIWQNIAFSRHMSFHAEASALAALQSQDKGFPHPAPKGTMLAASPRLVCLRHWKSKWREKKQLEFEGAALEVCNLPWRAQWRWQHVLPISLSCVTGILWALLAAKAFQSLKKKESCKCDQLGDAVRLMHIPSSQWITSYWEESSTPWGILDVLQWHLFGEGGITFWVKAGTELGQEDIPCHILAKMHHQLSLLHQSPLCLPGKQKE